MSVWQPSAKTREDMRKGSVKQKAKGEFYFSLRLLCRNEATRTPDPYVPNVVRYQLRYIPIFFINTFNN